MISLDITAMLEIIESYSAWIGLTLSILIATTLFIIFKKIHHIYTITEDRKIGFFSTFFFLFFIQYIAATLFYTTHIVLDTLLIFDSAVFNNFLTTLSFIGSYFLVDAMLFLGASKIKQISSIKGSEIIVHLVALVLILISYVFTLDLHIYIIVAILLYICIEAYSNYRNKHTDIALYFFIGCLLGLLSFTITVSAALFPAITLVSHACILLLFLFFLWGVRTIYHD